MEPPSSLTSWVNPFPSRFINRMACFWWKVSYFREFVCLHERNKVGWSRTQKPVLWPFSFYTIHPFFTILKPPRSGYHEVKVNELPDWDWAWSDGTKAVNWGSRKGYLCEWFFLPSWIPHLSMHLEKSRRLSVLWTIWNFSMISAEKVPGSFDFCHHRGVDFAS